MKIETKKAILRPWLQSDADRLAAIANNKKIYDNLRDAFPHPYTIDDAKHYIAKAQELDATSNLFAIEKDGVAIGSIGAFFKSDVYRKNVEIGYFLAEEYWGKGLMTSAVFAFVKHLFLNFDIIRIYAEPFARNKGSRKVLEKAGFKLEAVLKKNIIKNEIIEDSCIYSILRENLKQIFL